MTDGHHTPQASRGARPSWLTEPCPPWCTREHHEDDHPEDRIHQDDGVVIPVVLAEIDSATMRPTPRAVELVIRKVGPIADDRSTWISIQETEGPDNYLLLSEQSAGLVSRTLQET